MSSWGSDLILIALASTMLATASVAQSVGRKPVQASHASRGGQTCKPTSRGIIYRNYQRCMYVNTKLGWSPAGMSPICHRLCWE